ncbi:MAG: NAD(P)/FAD-dependent oxidoreductase [Bryobacterales bacterium]|nr:NAD(P)/FAD-dependent oxidoreductase [Bryobacterales bacterium]
MRSVAVVGGGPAGAMAAEGLARRGFQVTLVDENMAWEKPCGGGVTQKAYLRYPFLAQVPTSHAAVCHCQLRADDAKPYRLQLQHPVLIYARKDLNQLLLDRAAAAGAQLEALRISALERTSTGWLLHRKGASLCADFVVTATGARNPLREYGAQWTSKNAMLAIGYYLPLRTAQLDIQFYSWLQGYLWVFPRGNHVSVGICGKGANQSAMRAALERYLDERGIPWKEGRFYAHLIPALEPEDWPRNRVAGDGWLAVGDAAGLVDPLTGEGIYYAMRSGELAAECLSVHASGAAQAEIPTAYQQALQQDFTAELAIAAKLARVFYLGDTGLGTAPRRMIQLARYNGHIRQLLQDLVSGAQDYSGLRARVSGSLHARVLATLTRYLRSSYARLEGLGADAAAVSGTTLPSSTP